MNRNSEKNINYRGLNDEQGNSGMHKHNRYSSGWCSMKRRLAKAASFFLFFLCIFGVLTFAGLLDTFQPMLSGPKAFKPTSTQRKQEFPLQCAPGNHTQTCPRNYPTSHNPTNPITCPTHFRWIHEDLRAWKDTGITRGMIEKARKTAHFRLVIVDGKAYVEKFRKSIQTRDVFTLWGILQLLRVYPGKLPDLELMFDCDDRPVVPSKDFRDPKSGPPPLFRYCSDASSLDIVFPDWSFWGWAEINIKPWKDTLAEIIEGNRRIKWKNRVPYAYWKGNPHVAPTRKDLLKCNVSEKAEWNTRLYIQDWDKEAKQGFKESNLGNQCNYRYKIYIEGWAWSVSEKYILACDSTTTIVTPHYHDFFTRGMEPLEHYWPIRENKKCTSLKFAVEWGNNHTDKAESIGKASSNLIRDDLKMEFVYDYMYHLLNEYAKLLTFKPKVAEGAVELCPETMACAATGTWKKFMVQSMVKSPSEVDPCMMPPPYDVSNLRGVLERRKNIVRQVEMWEDEYWKSQRT